MKNIIVTIFVGFVAGTIGTVVSFKFLLSDNSRLSQENTYVAQQTSHNSFDHFVNNSEQSSSNTVLSKDFVEASKRSLPSVVYIKTVLETRYSSSWFEWFLGNGTTGQSISSGSGVIYKSSGYIITNKHVIENATEIQVMINKKTYSAKIVGSDPSTDLAILKIEASKLPAITIGKSRNVEVGEWVLAVGNPFNLTSTVTAGIVSAKGRDLNIIKSTFPIESFIQTDAPINAGNSGGALVNLKGELIGINTAILSRTGSYTGYGFAVPSDIVVKVVNDIIKHGEVQKAFFGGTVVELDEQMMKELEIKDMKGVMIDNIQEQGAAQKAKLKEGDRILKINNMDINSRSMFEEVLSYYSPGDVINVVYKRKNSIKTTSLTLTNREGTTKIIKKQVYRSESLGADFEKVSKVEQDLYKISHGVKIVKISKGFIQQLGLKEEFIITHINSIPIKDAKTLADILIKLRGRVTIEGINKYGQQGYYTYYF